MAKKKNNNPYRYVDGFPTGRNTPFATLSDMQALSPTYQKLSDSAKTTLMICKLARKNHTGTYTEGTNKGKSRTIQGNVLYFHFNRAFYTQYGLHNPNKVRKALIELVEAGFIDVVECNANRKAKNVYAYSWKWQQKDEGKEIELSQPAKTFIQGKRK